MRKFLIKSEKFFDYFANFLGILSAICLFLLAFFVFYNVCARYFFHSGNVAFQELEWHFFAAMFMLGMVYSLKEDAHVRVDVLFENFSPKIKAIINILGTLLFIIPFAFLVAYLSFDFVIEAYTSKEGSGDPGGLPYRFIIKSLIPISFLCLIFYSFGFILKNINAIFDLKDGKTVEFLQKTSGAKEV